MIHRALMWNAFLLKCNRNYCRVKGKNMVNGFERNVNMLAAMSCGWLALSDSPRFSLLYEKTHLPSVCANAITAGKEVLFSSLDNVLLSARVFAAEAVGNRNSSIRDLQIDGRFQTNSHTESCIWREFMTES